MALGRGVSCIMLMPLMLLNVIKSMGCSRELTERNWKGNRGGRPCQHIHTCIFIHKCKDQSAYMYFTGVDNPTTPRHMLSPLSLRVEPISLLWFAIDLEDARLVLHGCIPPFDLCLLAW
jgi:hypothetical protein